MAAFAVVDVEGARAPSLRMTVKTAAPEAPSGRLRSARSPPCAVTSSARTPTLPRRATPFAASPPAAVKCFCAASRWTNPRSSPQRGASGHRRAGPHSSGSIPRRAAVVAGAPKVRSCRFWTVRAGLQTVRLSLTSSSAATGRSAPQQQYQVPAPASPTATICCAPTAAASRRHRLRHPALRSRLPSMSQPQFNDTVTSSAARRSSASGRRRRRRRCPGGTSGNSVVPLTAAYSAPP